MNITNRCVSCAYIIIFFVSLLSALSANGQVRLHGRVTDGDNNPIEFVTVRVAGTIIGTTTGVKGDYMLTTKTSDTLNVVFTCIGYKEVRRELIRPEGDVTLNVRMFRANHNLGEVEISEFKKQTGSMETIDAASYRMSPDVSGGSIESLITTMAGVTSSNEMSSQYSVRGGSYDENSVYINGIEVYRPQLISSGQQEGLSTINPYMVDKVSFSSGGFKAEYGDKMSSVLDITYRQPESFEGIAGISMMGGNIAIGSASSHFSQMQGIRYKRNSSLLGTMDTKGEYDPDFFDYQINLNWRMNSHWRMSLLGNIAVNNYKFTPQDRVTSFGTLDDAKQFKVYFDGHEKDRFETYSGALALQYTPDRHSDFTLLAAGYLTNELVAYDITGEYWLDQAGTGGDEGIGGELGVGRYHDHTRDRFKASVMQVAMRGNTIYRRHTLSYGLGFIRQNVYERSREWELRDSAGFSLPSDGESLKMVYNLASHQDEGSNRFNCFVQDTYRVTTGSGYISLNGGIRVSYWDFNKEWLVSPRFNIGFIPAANSGWALRAAAGLYYQSPFYKEYRLIVADENGNNVVSLNRDIKSQRSIHVIAGADYTFRSFNRPFKLTAEVYCKVLNDIIPYEIDNLKLIYSGKNEAKGIVSGIDFKLFGQFVPGSDSWLSFSFMKSQETLHGIKVPRPNDRRYSFGIYFTDYFPKFPRLKVSLRGIFEDGLPTAAPHSGRDKGYFRTPAYKRVDIGLSYALIKPVADNVNASSRIIKSMWLGVDCFNLFDISNVSSYYWVTDVNNIRYAVPNYLTRRLLNLRLTVDF